jgi:phosphoglycolate phosphatase
MATIIFDMDGTLADSFDYVADFLGVVRGLGPLSDEQKHRLRHLSMIAMARRLGFHWWDAPWLLFQGRRRMHHAIKEVKAFHGITELVRQLHGQGHNLYVLSTNSPRNVNRFLNEQKIHKYFLAVYGGAGLFNKAPSLKKLLKYQNVDRDQAVYVGDEIRDIQAAKSVGIKAIAVSWGFASRDHLKALRPDALADTPAELARQLKKI